MSKLLNFSEMPENQSVKERLLLYLSHKHLNKSQFGASIGASASFVDAIRSSISPEKLEKMMDTYPDLNIVWLLTGREQMLKQEQVQSATADPGPGSTINVHHNGVVNIDTLNQKLELIQKELMEMKEERKSLLAIIENLSKR